MCEYMYIAFFHLLYIYIYTGRTFIHRLHLGLIIFLAPKDEINATKPQRNQSGVMRWSNTQTGKQGGVEKGGNAGGTAIRNVVLWCVVLCSVVQYCVQRLCAGALHRSSVQ